VIKNIKATPPIAISAILRLFVLEFVLDCVLPILVNARPYTLTIIKNIPLNIRAKE
jgi:hypothetical protein